MKSHNVTIQIKATEEYFPIYGTAYYAIRSDTNYNYL